MKFGKWVVKCRIPILILAVALLVPSLIGMIMTRSKHDLPASSIEKSALPSLPSMIRPA